jgi:hypothetical protein
VWLPQTSQDMHRINVDRARASGLRCRPLAQTLADTAAGLRSTPMPGAAAGAASAGPARAAAGLTSEREQALLQAWQAGQAAPTP